MDCERISRGEEEPTQTQNQGDGVRAASAESLIHLEVLHVEKLTHTLFREITAISLEFQN